MPTSTPVVTNFLRSWGPPVRVGSGNWVQDTASLRGCQQPAIPFLPDAAARRRVVRTRGLTPVSWDSHARQRARLAAMLVGLVTFILSASTRSPVGQFTGSGDGGEPAMAGATSYDASLQHDRMSAGGTNMWGSSD